MQDHYGVHITGRLGNEPEPKTTPKGTEMVSINVAITGPKKNGEHITIWRRCVAFGSTAEYIKNYCKKGAKVLIVGTETEETYTDRVSGQEKKSISITIDKIFSLDGRKTTETAQSHHHVIARQDDDVPF